MSAFILRSNKLLLKQSLDAIKQQCTRIQQRISHCSTTYRISLLQKVFSRLMMLLKTRQKHMQLHDTSETNLKKQVIMQWRKSTLVRQSIGRMMVVIRKLTFRRLFRPLTKQVVRSYMLGQQQRASVLRQFFQHLAVVAVE